MKRPYLIGLAVPLLLGVALAGIYYRLLTPRDPVEQPVPEQTHGPVWFEERAAAAGIDFKHFDPATPVHLISETMGSGIGWIDYDADGWPDLFCVQSNPLPPAAGNPALGHRLFRNNRDGTFTDVTAQVGPFGHSVGCGCAVGDYDNDGYDDLLVTSLGGLQLFHNEADPQAPGGRRLVDVTAKSGLKTSHWATSAAWGDLDGDGLLDLYVCHYVVIDPDHPLVCPVTDKPGVYFSCNPTMYPFTAHRLYRNNGQGTFTDVSESSGIARLSAPGLAVAILDLDADGRQDIFVANDMAPQFFFRNLGGMKFEESALIAGLALGPGGARIAGMGIVVADFHSTGRPDLLVTNFQKVPNVLFQNAGPGRFNEVSFPSGLGSPSMDRLAFGCCDLDANLDGHADLAIANGHVYRSAAIMGFPFAQGTQLFLGDGAGKFREISPEAGADFHRPRVGRGLARADYNRDGRPDLAMSSVGEPLALFTNRSETDHAWISLELVGDGRKSNRNAIGSVLRLKAGGRAQTHFLIGGGTYQSANERVFHLGLGQAHAIELATVRWPSGVEQEYRGLVPGKRWRMVEGRAEAEVVP